MADLTKEFEFDIGSIALVPSDGGRFEVTVDEKLVYSKLKTGRHAEEGEVVGLVGEIVPGGDQSVRALVQRVRRGRVSVGEDNVAEIGPGMVILLGVGEHDTEAEASWLAAKCANLRVFEDSEGKMNYSLRDSGGEAIVVSQFTLYGDVRKGRRPSFVHAAEPSLAEPLVDRFAANLREEGISTQTGAFGEQMVVEIENDGPVTLMIERQTT